MTTATTPPTRSAVSAHRARIVGDAVISAYIRELAPTRSELAPARSELAFTRSELVPAAAQPSGGEAAARADARDDVRRIPVGRRPASFRRLAERGAPRIRIRPPHPLAAGEHAVGAHLCVLGGAD